MSARYLPCSGPRSQSSNDQISAPQLTSLPMLRRWLVRPPPALMSSLTCAWRSESNATSGIAPISFDAWNLALLRQGNRVVNSLAASLGLVQEHAEGRGKTVDDRRRNKRWWAGQSARPPRLCQRARRAHASLGDTVTTVSVIPTGPGAAGVISPNFFLFVTTMGVIVS